VHLLATEYPDVSFIIPHLGSFSDDWRAQTAVIPQLVSYANVYTDTSGIRRFDILEEALHRAGPAKVLFGSDGPWLHPGVELAKIHALHLQPAAERLVLGGNFLRLIAHAGRVRGKGLMPAVPPNPLPERSDPWAGEQFQS
jgi:predicted TIM-barrel fold metal-dependent hydrolase